MNENNINNIKPGIEIKNEKNILGKLTMTRHSKTNYTEKYPDITEDGRKIAEERAEKIVLKNTSDNEERYYFSSSRPRAKSTAEIIKNKFGDESKDLNISDQIRAIDFYDTEKAMELFNEIRGEENDPSNIDKSYSADKRFEENPEILEPRSKINKRAMRAFEYLIRSFEKAQSNKIPHVLATGHFELINPIIDNIFEVGDETFEHVEDVEITFLNSENIKEKVSLIIKFRDQEKKVTYDRVLRQIIV